MLFFMENTKYMFTELVLLIKKREQNMFHCTYSTCVTVKCEYVDKYLKWTWQNLKDLPTFFLFILLVCEIVIFVTLNDTYPLVGSTWFNLNFTAWN